MTQDVLKYLQPNAAIPIDMETTSLLVNALKKALAEHAMREVQRLGQEIEQDADSFCDSNCVWTDHHPDCKLAQPDQEPVGHREGYWCVDLTCKKCYSADFRLKHTPPQRTEQEPAGWEVGVVDGVVTRRLAPPQRTWVGLTDEDYFAVLEKLQNLYHRPPIAIFAKAIEQTLKEKNT